MKDIVPDTNVMVTTTEHDLISHEKAYVKMDTGCVWTYLLHDGVRVGIAFLGSAHFAVDAIAETSVGAIGESVTGTLEGIQLYLGKNDLESLSRPASTEDLKAHEFNDSDAFTKAVNSAIKAEINGDLDRKFDVDTHTCVFIGKDSDNKTVILVVKEGADIVFTHGKTVFVVGKENLVSVSKSGVVITRPGGRDIVIGKGGIHGLDNLVDIGPIVTQSVNQAMDGLRGLKSLKSIKKSRRNHQYDDLDSFDWDD